MPTINKSLLVALSGEGFVLDSISQFSSVVYTSGEIRLIKPPPANPNTYQGVMQQNSTANTYQDWGVPAGSRVTGMRLLGGSLTLLVHPDELDSASCQFFTQELDLGTYDITSGGSVDNSSGAVLALDKLASDYVRAGVSGTIITKFNPSGYDGAELHFLDFEVEVTYETRKKGNMFFGAN